MSKTPKIKVIKAFSCWLVWKERSTLTEYDEKPVLYWDGSGYYWGKTRCVRIYGVGPYRTRKTYEIKLEIRVDGVEYERRYYKKFSERGLCLISCRFIRDVENMHKKRRKK